MLNLNLTQTTQLTNMPLKLTLDEKSSYMHCLWLYLLESEERWYEAASMHITDAALRAPVDKGKQQQDVH